MKNYMNFGFELSELSKILLFDETDPRISQGP